MVARLRCRVDARRESAVQVLRGLRASFIEKRFVDIALWLHRPGFVIAMSSMEGRGPASSPNRAESEKPPGLDASLTSASLTPFGRGNSRGSPSENGRDTWDGRPQLLNQNLACSHLARGECVAIVSPCWWRVQPLGILNRRDYIVGRY